MVLARVGASITPDPMVLSTILAPDPVVVGARLGYVCSLNLDISSNFAHCGYSGGRVSSGTCHFFTRVKVLHRFTLEPLGQDPFQEPGATQNDPIVISDDDSEVTFVVYTSSEEEPIDSYELYESSSDEYEPY